MLRVHWHAGTLVNLEDRSFLKTGLGDRKSTTVIAYIGEEFPKKLFLARASLHQRPFVGLDTTGIVCASNKELGFVKLYHLVAERVW